MHSFTTLLTAVLTFALLATAHNTGHGASDLVEARAAAPVRGSGHHSHNASIAEDHVPVFKSATCDCPAPICPGQMNAKSVKTTPRPLPPPSPLSPARPFVGRVPVCEGPLFMMEEMRSDDADR